MSFKDKLAAKKAQRAEKIAQEVQAVETKVTEEVVIEPVPVVEEVKAPVVEPVAVEKVVDVRAEKVAAIKAEKAAKSE